MHGMTVDNFAGGGGARLGIEMALGRSIDVAINHDAEAIAMHRAEHEQAEEEESDMTRTYGETRNCSGCRYWSEMLAEVRNGQLKAICIAPTEPTKYRSGRESCDSWASGHLGAIDEPGNDPDRYDDEAALRGPDEARKP